MDTQLKKNSGPRKRIPDTEISIMYDRSFTYVGKIKKKWEREGKWTGPTNMREIKRGGASG
ncbi:hypothetical protein GH820_10865 [Bacillus thuringiensis]|nr:hypothetical protein [Bacillus thuringiensis]